MIKPSLHFNPCVLFGLSLFAASAYGAANPTLERVRQDLGYYDKPSQNKTLETINSKIQEIHQLLEKQENRLQKVEDELKQLNRTHTAKSTPQPQTAPPPSTEAAKPQVSKDKFTVCSQGCDFRDLQTAVNAAPPGGTVTLAPELSNSCAVINKPLKLVGQTSPEGIRARLSGGVCWGKGPLVTLGENIVIENIEIFDVTVPSGNGSCVRIDPGTKNLTLRNIHCHNAQIGILGSADGILLIEDSTIEQTAPSHTLSHGVYLIKGEEAIIRRSKILSTNNRGHTLKSGFQKLTVEDSILAGLKANNSRAIDAFGGGELILRNNVIEQGPSSDNRDVIGYGLEPNRMVSSGHKITLERNWFIFDDPDRFRVTLIRGQDLGPVIVQNNYFVGIGVIGMDPQGKAENRWFNNREEAGLSPFDGTLNSLPKPGSEPNLGGKR